VHILSVHRKRKDLDICAEKVRHLPMCDRPVRRGMIKVLICLFSPSPLTESRLSCVREWVISRILCLGEVVTISLRCASPRTSSGLPGDSGGPPVRKSVRPPM